MLDRAHTFLMKRPGGSVLCRFDLSGAKDKIAVISGRRVTYELMNRLIARHGAAPEAWVPHFERHAPAVVDQPVKPHYRNGLSVKGWAESGFCTKPAPIPSADDDHRRTHWKVTHAANCCGDGEAIRI